MLEGDAVRSYTLMFLQMWNAVHENRHEDYGYYLDSTKTASGSDVYDSGLRDSGTHGSDEDSANDFDGIFIPYGVGPQSKISVAQSVYLHLINTATDTLYIMTPYFVIDDEMLFALMRAAKRGVDVRIVLPRIPDKRLIYMISRSYYPKLIESGVKIYEYLPGFVHTKMVCADKKEAVTGTINMDFRSLYLHYECACLMYNNPVVDDISADFEQTFTESAEISMRDYKNINIFERFIGKVLRIIAPLV